MTKRGSDDRKGKARRLARERGIRVSEAHGLLLQARNRDDPPPRDAPAGDLAVAGEEGHRLRVLGVRTGPGRLRAMQRNMIWAVGALTVVAAVLWLCWVVGPLKAGLVLGGVSTPALAAAHIRHARRRAGAERAGAGDPPERWSHLIPGVAELSTPAEITACMERAHFATVWDAARTWAGGLVMWHVTVYPRAWTARAYDAATYGAWAGDLIAAAIVDSAREDGLGTGDGSALLGLGLNRPASRLADLRTALAPLTRHPDTPAQYAETAQYLSALAAGDADQQAAALYTAGIARQVLAAHCDEGTVLGDRIPALAQREATRTMWHHRPNHGPYRGARPLADQREHVDLLAAALLHHRQAGSTGPARQERAYRLHRAVLDDRVALLWPGSPPGELAALADQSARRLLEWDRTQPGTSQGDCQQPRWYDHPRDYVRHVYRQDTVVDAEA
ncbi:hypothetical protein GCM10010433_50220 [Streptomyces pulveraceus]|uniref:DUF2786 domain-containing protein n=1 Tax=Streptomyces pulveraceus TaxID=68258 RepID=A0ABW1GK23_9ACTN